jgi:hypothetical protein
MLLQGSLPKGTRHSDSAGIHPATRNIIVISLAALCGTIIGGLSVLSIVAAVTPPPSHDAPLGSAVFDGPHKLSMQPVADTPAGPIGSGRAAPNTVSSQPPQPVEAQVLPLAQEAQSKQSPAPWPDALTARSSKLSESGVASQSNARPVYDFYNDQHYRDDSSRGDNDNWGSFFGWDSWNKNPQR